MEVGRGVEEERAAVEEDADDVEAELLDWVDELAVLDDLLELGLGVGLHPMVDAAAHARLAQRREERDQDRHVADEREDGAHAQHDEQRRAAAHVRGERRQAEGVRELARQVGRRGDGGIRGGGWDVNPFSWVWGMHLPAAVVCLNALVAHLEPVASAWCSEWTGRYLTPSGELLSRGFELLRLYGYVALLCPAAFVALLACLMPQWLAAWAASGAPRAYIPTAEQGLTALLHLTMLVDAGAIVFALASFRMPRGKAKLCAVAAATAGLAALAATDTLHAARHAHRAALLAVVPPFTVLVLTLTPVLWPAAPAPRAAAAAAAAAGGGGGPRDDEDEDDESDDEEGAGSGSDYEDSEWSDLS